MVKHLPKNSLHSLITQELVLTQVFEAKFLPCIHNGTLHFIYARENNKVELVENQRKGQSTLQKLYLNVLSLEIMQ